MAYDRQTWANGPTGQTPLSAARLNHLELGVEGAASTADEAASTAAAAAATAGDALPADGGTMTGELEAEAGIANPTIAAAVADGTVPITDVAYTTTGLATDVIVGSSGRLKITVTAEVRMTAGVGPVRICADLDEAAAANARSAVSDSTTWATVERTAVLTGLTPGAHTVRLAGLITTGGDTAEARHRSLIAEPI